MHELGVNVMSAITEIIADNQKFSVRKSTRPGNVPARRGLQDADPGARVALWLPVRRFI
jgi:hypothetical protein